MRLLLTLLLLYPLPALAGDPLLNVSYDGFRSFPSGEELPLRTRFFGSENGLAGSYHFVGDGKMDAGSLTFLEQSGGVLRFEWTSFNGVGLLEVEIAEDGRSFQGQWIGPRGTRGTWTGQIREP